jgi:hypothetical protein
MLRQLMHPIVRRVDGLTDTVRSLRMRGADAARDIGRGSDWKQNSHSRDLSLLRLGSDLGRDRRRALFDA